MGKSSSTFDLGMIGNIISGLIGGGVLGQIVTLLLPAITAAAQSGPPDGHPPTLVARADEVIE